MEATMYEGCRSHFPDAMLPNIFSLRLNLVAITWVASGSQMLKSPKSTPTFDRKPKNLKKIKLWT